jgi:hypothetical protein
MMRIFLILLGCSMTLSAQVNTERMRRMDAGEGWFHEIGVSMSVFGGNSRLLLLSGSYRMDWVRDKYYSFIVGNYLRGTSEGNLVLHRGFAHVRLQRSLARPWKIEAFAQKEFNDFIQLKDRQLGGGGLRFEWFDQDTGMATGRPVNISIGSGLMVEHEQFSGQTKPDTRFVRSTNYIAVRFKRNPQTFLYSVGYFQAAVEEPSAYRILVESSAGLGLSKYLTVTVSFNYRYDHRPAMGVRRYDYSISNGLTLSF